MRKVIIASILIGSQLCSQTHAEIPFNQALGVYNGTKDEYKAISPFWGMVAIHGGLLERIRFFGNYTDKTNDKNEVIEEAQDPISKLIKELFPSPDGVQFVANTKGKYPVGDLSRNLSKINDLIAILIHEKFDSDTKVKGLVDLLNRIGKKTKENDIKAFAQLLVSAYEKQGDLANPKKRDQQLYPENIVIISLLSFFCKVADDKSAFKDLSFLMDNKFEDKSVFTYKEYTNNKNKVKEIVLNADKDPEPAFLMAEGYDAYENPFMSPIQYRGDTKFSGGKETFSDCGETSLRNILMMLLGEKGVVPEEALDQLKNNIKPSENVDLANKDIPFQKMLSFFEKNPSLSNASTLALHNEWANVVSNLNGKEKELGLNDIVYGRGDKTYEIKSNISTIGVNGIINMLNVIAKIIPDEQLNEPWDKDEATRYKQAAEKLTRFCNLLSWEGHDISWKNREEQDQTIKDPFVTITFLINNTPAYNWKFIPGHFQLDTVADPKNDWRLNFKDALLTNEWMGSLYLKLNEAKFVQDDTYGEKLPLNLIYNSGLPSVEGAVTTLTGVLYETIFHDKLRQFVPLIGHWITRSIPLDDTYALNKVSLLLYTVKDSDKVKGEIAKILGDPRFKSLKDKVDQLEKTNPEDIVEDIVKKGLNTELILFNKKVPIKKLDLSQARIMNETLHHLSNLTSLRLVLNEKITDEGLKGLTNLTSLNLFINKMITDTGLKGLTNLTSLNLSKNEMITDTGLEGLINLTSLDLGRNEKITDTGLKGLTNLTSLSLWGNDKITDAGLKDLTNLTSLDLQYNSKITDKGLEGLTNLTSLNLRGSKTITNAGLKDLTKLTSLDLSDNEKITDEGLEGLTKLTSLDLSRNEKITDTGLKGLTNLTSLSLWGNDKITDAGLKDLTNLTSLDLHYNSKITDKGLEGLTNLTALNLEENETITNDFVKELRERNPNIKIIGR